MLERFAVRWIRFAVRKRGTLKAGDDSTRGETAPAGRNVPGRKGKASLSKFGMTKGGLAQAAAFLSPCSSIVSRHLPDFV
jgi:hypothetical protein